MNRETILGGIFAENAVTEIPTPPVPNVSYRNENLDELTISDGWPYTKVVNSADFNEYLRRMSTLVYEMEKQGILSWNKDTTYGIGAICYGSDGLIYRSLADSNIGNDPISSTLDWIIADSSSLAFKDFSNTNLFKNLPDNSDFNTIIDPGIYIIRGQCPNSPNPSSQAIWSLTVSTSQTEVVQNVTAINTEAGYPNSYIRTNISGWQSWIILTGDFATADLGNVTQIGIEKIITLNQFDYGRAIDITNDIKNLTGEYTVPFRGLIIFKMGANEKVTVDDKISGVTIFFSDLSGVQRASVYEGQVLSITRPIDAPDSKLWLAPYEGDI